MIEQRLRKTLRPVPRAFSGPAVLHAWMFRGHLHRDVDTMTGHCARTNTTIPWSHEILRDGWRFNEWFDLASWYWREVRDD